MRYQIIKNKYFVEISGSEALSFLQNIMTADIQEKTPAYSLMLNPQGRYLSDFFIVNYSNSFLLEIPTSHKNEILAKLKMYKLRSDVHIKDISDEYFPIFSDDQLLQKAIISYQDPRINQYYRSILSKTYEQEFLQNDYEFYNYLKYSQAIIEGSDMVYEKSIPIEYGMENFNAISFTKGCYIGQEIISRTKYTGVIRKKIHIVESENHELKGKQEDEVLINGEKMGKICSVWKNKAIILMKEGSNADAEWEINGIRVSLCHLK